MLPVDWVMLSDNKTVERTGLDRYALVDSLFMGKLLCTLCACGDHCRPRSFPLEGLDSYLFYTVVGDCLYPSLRGETVGRHIVSTVFSPATSVSTRRAPEVLRTGSGCTLYRWTRANRIPISSRRFAMRWLESRWKTHSLYVIRSAKGAWHVIW